MQNLNHAIATGRLSEGDEIENEGEKYTIRITVATVRFYQDGRIIRQIARNENLAAGTGQYMISANNVIHHTFERKLLNNPTEYRV